MARITAIVNAHREAELAQFALRSARLAIEHAREHGIDANLLVVIDCGDDITQSVIANSLQDFPARVQAVDFGDLAVSRNYGIQQAQSEFVAFLDADDLWCKTWLTRSHRFAMENGEKTICHPEINLVFGVDEGLFPHPDQLSPQFSLQSLRCINYWTALSFARRSVYEHCPYQPNRIDEGFGYEDWAWNCDTIFHGYIHRVVPHTTHFLRRKPQIESLRVKTKNNYCLRSPSLLFQRDAHSQRQRKDAPST